GQRDRGDRCHVRRHRAGQEQFRCGWCAWRGPVYSGCGSAQPGDHRGDRRLMQRFGGAVLSVILSLTGSYPVSAQEAAPPHLSLYVLIARPSDSGVVATAAQRWHLRVTRHSFGVLSLVVRADSLTVDRRALLDSLRAIRRSDGTRAVEGAEY